jgi:IstB-like ATP binding protein
MRGRSPNSPAAIGRTGTGKTHLSIAIVATVVRARARGRFFNLVDLVNQLEAEKAAGSGRLSRPSCASISPLSTSSAIFPSAMPAVPPQSCLRQPQVFGHPKMTTAMLERITGNEAGAQEPA